MSVPQESMATIVKRFGIIEEKYLLLKDAMKNKNSEDIELASQNFEASFLLNVNDILHEFERSTIALNSEARDDILSEQAELMNIKAVACDGDLYLRVPHPPKRTSRFFIGNKHKIQSEVLKVSDQITSYSHKWVNIFHIYSSQDAKQSNGLDFDNYDMKSILDEVCRPYPREDSPTTTSMMIQHHITDGLLPMTYLIVSNSPVSFDENRLLNTFK